MGVGASMGLSTRILVLALGMAASIISLMVASRTCWTWARALEGEGPYSDLYRA
jgi:hypothetical protein